MWTKHITSDLDLLRFALDDEGSAGHKLASGPAAKEVFDACCLQVAGQLSRIGVECGL